MFQGHKKVWKSGGVRSNPPPGLGRSVNPISARGRGQIIPTTLLLATPHIFRPSYDPVMERTFVDKGWKWMKVLDVLLGRYSEVTLRSLKLSVWKVCHLVQLPVPEKISNQNAEKQKYLRGKFTKLQSSVPNVTFLQAPEFSG